MRTLREFESSGEVGRMSSSKVASSFDTAFCTSRSALRSLSLKTLGVLLLQLRDCDPLP